MKNEEFKAWLLGYIELSENAPVSEQQTLIINNHVNLVKAIEGYLSQENQTLIDQLHS